MRDIIFVTLTFLIISRLLFSAGQQKGFKCTIGNERCALPFPFGQKTYDACTTDGIGGERSWCPKQLYPNGTADIHYCMECWGEQRCYYTADAFPDSIWTITCPSGCYYVQKNVYGTNNEFSSQSYICASAIHQGLISNETGAVITLRKLPRRKDFIGAEKNGVKTYSSKSRDVQRMRVERSKVTPLPNIIVLQEKTISSLPSNRILKTLRTGPQTIGSIACDVRQKKIYWSNPNSATIMRADYDGRNLKNLRAVISGNQVARPEHIALDWIKKKLYWTDSVDHTVSVSDINGQAIQVLFRRDRNFKPKGLALDLKNGYLYIADGGNPPKISRCSTGNSPNCEVVIGQNIASPSGIAINSEATMFCWTDSKIPLVSCADLDGSNRRDMKFAAKRLKAPNGIAIFDGTVYWTDVSWTILASAKISDWNSFHIHYGDLEKAHALSIFDLKTQLKFDPPAPTVGKNDLDVYVADTDSIRRFRIDVSKNSIVKVELVTSGLKSATALAVDTKKDEIYWTDSVDKKIYKTVLSRIPNSGRTVVIEESGGNILKPEGIAIDSVNRLLYWTDIDLHGVYIANLDLKNNERYVAAIYIGDADYKPRGLALSPDEGYVYIADSGEPYRVQRCETKYNGACTDFISKNLKEPLWIAMDDIQRRIYVSTTGENKLLWTSYLGIGRGQIKSEGLNTPYGLGIHKDRIYVSDTKSKSVTSFDVRSGGSPFKIGDGLKNPLGIFLHDHHGEIGKNHCLGSKCRYICVPAGRERQSCLCPEQYRGIRDDEECEIIPPCQNSPCMNKGRCIENARRSDYTCECPLGYTGKTCGEVSVKLVQETDPSTGAIHLKCIAPREIKSQVVWYHNKLELDLALHWVKVDSTGRTVTIERPRYTYSGVFQCQISDNGFQRRASITVKIKANIKFTCGEAPGLFKAREAERKLFGGIITKYGNAPFVAMLAKPKQHENLGSKVFCGGSLVTTKHVVSAAHCFDGISIKEARVYVGKHQARLDIEERMEQSSSITKLVTHPQYNPKSLHADYAIITVENEFYFTALVKPICIALPTDKGDDVTPRSRGKNTRRGVVYGWGLIESGEGAKRMREVTLPILKQSKCKASYNPGHITDLMFCAGGGTLGDACKGDSGGPFTLWSDKKNRWYLGGLVSKGEACVVGSASKKPGVYARIGSAIRKWIYVNTDLEL